jgi:hypothetical protein
LSVVEACVSFDRFVRRKSASPFRPGEGGSPEPSFGRKLFIDAHAFRSVPSTEKCSALNSPFTSGAPSSEQRNRCPISWVSRRSRFFEKVEASKIFSSIESPTNQRNRSSYSSRSTSCRSERIEYKSCRSEARSSRSGGIDGRPNRS